MTLRQKQSLFFSLKVKLLAFGLSQGYEFTSGESYVKSPRKVWWTDDVGEQRRKTVSEDAEHMKGSLHHLKLADDYNLFVNGRYIRSSTNPAYVQLGTYWESLHPLCRWGGRFSDANHFSISHAGKA